VQQAFLYCRVEDDLTAPRLAGYELMEENFYFLIFFIQYFNNNPSLKNYGFNLFGQRPRPNTVVAPHALARQHPSH
jgi:hypothetical protein